MSELRIYNNVFEKEYDSFEYDLSRPLLEQVEEHLKIDTYKDTLVECYDTETGKTFYAPMVDDVDAPSVLIFANEKNVDKTYQPVEGDLISVVYLPANERAGYIIGGVLAGAVAGLTLAGIAVALGGAALLAIPSLPWIVGGMGVLGAAAGGFLMNKMYDREHATSKTYDSGKQGASAPDIRGAENVSLLNNNYPFVIGKHLITPFVVGDPYTMYSGEKGEDAYIRMLLCAGYGPLKLTDFKLGEFMLSYNRSHPVNGSTVTKPTYISGLLKGYSTNNVYGNGDIDDYWKNNDIELEIIQQPNNVQSGVVPAYFQSNTEIDLANRPLVPGTVLTSAGWSNATSGQVYTLFSQVYSNNDGTKSYLLTPIQANGMPVAYAQFTSQIVPIIKLENPGFFKSVQDRYKRLFQLAEFSGADSAQQAETYKQELEAQQTEFYSVTHINYGSIYPYTVKEQEINANVFYIADKDLDEQAQVTYKGTSFPNKFKTNGVFFTDSCPMEFTVNLDFPSGLYETYTYSDDSVSETRYGKIPLWVCAQWRVYNKNNPESQPDGSDYSSWNKIDFGYEDTFDLDAQEADMEAHRGNDFSDTSTTALYQGFRGKSTLQNFKNAGGDNGISEMRFSATIKLTKAQCLEVIGDNDPARCVEIRILRVSPNYINETSSSDDHESARSYSDHFKVTTVVTKVFDEDELRENNNLVAVRPQREADMRKFCYIAIKAKADASGYLINQLKKLNCIAESFSPIWDNTEKKILPEGVHKVTNYYGYYINGQKADRSNEATEVLLTDGATTAKEQYEEARHEGYNWLEEKAGSNFTEIMKGIVFASKTSHNNRTAYTLPEAAKKYNDNITSAGFLLGCVGAHNGTTGNGYEDIDVLAIQDWHEKIEALVDGTIARGTIEYNGVTYHDGDTIPLRMEANAYIYGGIKKEDLLQKLAFCGRAMWTIDETGKIRVVMDAPVDYTKGVINAQNCISSSNNYNYERLPAGLYLAFSDEDDGYNQNQIHCFDDGYDINNYHGTIEPYSIDYVTNRYQAWSIGRYVLACRLQQKETLSRKIGPEGVTYNVGDVVLIQGDDLLIGDGSGRVQEIIEENNVIYGFVMNSTFDYLAEEGTNGNSTQGVTIIQPGYMGKNNAVTIPISMPATKTITVTEGGQLHTYTYQLQKGRTNIILFGTLTGQQTPGITRGGNDPSTKTDLEVNVKTGDICMFGQLEKISAPYRITRIKPESGGGFTETLVPYDESIYMSGAKLPSFQNYITPPPVADPPMSISEVPTTLAEQNTTLQNVYDAIGVVKDDTPPATPTLASATASRDFINLAWYNSSTNVKETVIEISKSGGAAGTWTEVARIDSDNWKYYFKRSGTGSDGYPEASALSNYKFRLKSVSICNVDSEYTSAIDVTTTNYGTWVPATPTVTAVADRDGIDIKWTVASNYGTSKFTVTVTYNSTAHTVSVNGNNTARFNFNRGESRSQDAYPEASDLANWTISVKHTNEADSTGHTGTASSVDTADYGTWTPATPSFTSKIPNEGGITFNWNSATTSISGRELYGTPKYTVTVKYADSDHSVSETTKAVLVSNTLTVNYDFKRTGTNADGYPEASATADYYGLDKYTFQLKVENESGQHAETSFVGLSNDEINLYGTWIPAVPTKKSIEAEQDGIAIEWNAVGGAGGKQLYGGVTYKAYVYYTHGGTTVTHGTLLSDGLSTFYEFVRTGTGADGYPEKSTTVGNYPKLDEYTVKYEAINTVTNRSSGLGSAQTVGEDNYLGWLPNAPVIETRASGRSCTLNMINSERRYGKIRYKIQICRPDQDYDEQGGERTYKYYLPTPTSNPFGDEDNYKGNAEANPPVTPVLDTPILADTPYTQTMPLIDQNSTVYKRYSFVNSTDPYDYDNGTQKLLVYTDTEPPVSATEHDVYIDGVLVEDALCWTDSNTGLNYISFEVSMPSPKDTVFWWKVAAYNSVTESVDSKTSAYVTEQDGIKVLTTAFATSAYDVVKAGITENALAPDAVTTDKIAAGTITANKIFVESLAAISANLGKITDGSLVGNQNNYWYLTDEYSGGQIVHRAGDFRVGGSSSGDYIMCSTTNGTDYHVEIHASQFNITAIGTVVKGAFYVSPNSAVIDPNTGIPSSYYASIDEHGIRTGQDFGVQLYGPLEVYNNNDSVVAKINTSGEIYATGTLSVGTTSTSADEKLCGNLYVKNSSGNTTASISQDGKISGKSYSNTNITIKTGSNAKTKITLNTLMTWLITTKEYIPSDVACHVVLQTSWSYENNDILRLSIGGVDYELQLSGVIIEFTGNATDYQTGVFRLRIHSSPGYSFTATSGYKIFPVNHIAEYTCSAAGHLWRMIIEDGDAVRALSGAVTCSTAGSTADKIVQIPNFTLDTFSRFTIYMINESTAASPTLNVSGTGAYPIKHYTRDGLNVGNIPSGYYNCSLDYDYSSGSTAWIFTNLGNYESYRSIVSSNVEAFSYPIACNTGASEATKTVEITNFQLHKGCKFILAFNNTNSVASAKLDVNNTGAKTVYINGFAVTASNWTVGLYNCYYDGTNWRLDNSCEAYSARFAVNPSSVGGAANFGGIASCSTAAATAAKTAYCYGYNLIIGQVVKLYIANANSVASPTLNINSTGAKSIFVNGVAASSSTPAAGWYDCLYDGNYYQLYSSTSSVLPSSGCAVCHTAAATAAKVASMPNFKLESGTTFLITITNANTSASALTLNINGTGAKTIYINGSASSSSNYTLPAGTYLCRYNGTNYYIDTGYAVTHARNSRISNRAYSLDGILECLTASETAAKTATLEGFSLLKGARLTVRVSNSNSAQSALTLNINSTGAKPTRVNGTETSSSFYTLVAGYYNCYYDGTYWNMDSVYEANTARVARNARNTIAYCSTGASTVAKTATLEGYALTSGDRIMLYMANTNTASTPTLNVNSTGAKAIRINGSQAVSATYIALPKGFYMAHYDGTYWNLYNILNLATDTSFNGSSSAVTLDTAYGALGVKAWYFSASAGYIVFTNGLCIQWGEFASQNNVQQTYELALAYKNASSYTVALTQYWENGSGQYNANTFLSKKEAKKITLQGQSYGTTFIAIGYQ